MWTDVRVKLGNTWLHDLHSAIVVQRVKEGAAVTGRTTNERMNRFGSFFGDLGRPYMEIVVEFSVLMHGRENLSARRAVMDSIRAWAISGGDLRVSYRTGQHISVVCDGLPESGDIMDWTQEYAISFKAFNEPCWVLDTPSTGTATGSTGTITLTNGGTADAPVMISAKNNGTTKATYAKVTDENGAFIRVNADIEAGKTFTIDHSGGLLQIFIVSEDGSKSSALHRRSSASADDIIIAPGEHALTVESDVDLVWNASVKGRIV